jgi:hypothetical protein
MMDHVSARCGPYRLLFPSRNIEAIVTLGEEVSLLPLPPRARRGGASDAAEPEFPTLDLGRLLDPATGRSRRSGPTTPHGTAAERQRIQRIQLDWVSTDALRRVALIVDAVDEIVASPLQHLERVALLPARLLPLCDGVLRDPDATCRLSIRPDVEWPLATFADRRLWRSAWVQLASPAKTGAAFETEDATQSPVSA